MQDEKKVKASAPFAGDASNADAPAESESADAKPQGAHAGLNAKLSEYENDLKRLQAEFENYRKRVEKEKKEWAEGAKADAMRQMLVLADEFDAAKQHSANADAKALARGVDLLHAKLSSIFKSANIEEIKCNGHIDASLHDVLMQVEGGEEGKIASVVRKGYKLGSIILRHAQVAVYSGVKKEDGGGKEAAEKNNKTEEANKSEETEINDSNKQ